MQNCDGFPPPGQNSYHTTLSQPSKVGLLPAQRGVLGTSAGDEGFHHLVSQVIVSVVLNSPAIRQDC